MSIKIRNARHLDSGQILKLIKELAKFERLKPPHRKAKKRLIEDAFGKNPKFNMLVADGGSGKLLGYAFYFFTYSSFLANRTLYLEDIFITEKMRNKGIGKLFFSELLKIAKKNKCMRMEWAVLHWNINAIKFYEKLGAKELKEWKYYRYII